MENIIRVLAKEVRRLHALVELAEENGVYYSHGKKEYEAMKRMLAKQIRRKM